MCFHHGITFWIIMLVWTHPHYPITPLMELMESRHCCDMKVESSAHVHHNLPANTVFSLVPMGLINNPKTPWEVFEFAIAQWFHSGCQHIIRNKVNIASVSQLVKTGVLILMGKMCMFRMHQDWQFEINSTCHFVNDTVECLCHLGHIDYKDWFKGWCKHWLPYW